MIILSKFEKKQNQKMMASVLLTVVALLLTNICHVYLYVDTYMFISRHNFCKKKKKYIKFNKAMMTIDRARPDDDGDDGIGAADSGRAVAANIECRKMY